MVRPISQTNIALNRAPVIANGVSFSPDDIASLSAWWDPDDGTTLTQSAAPQVDAMDDKTGGGAGFSQITGRGLPDLVTIGDRNWLQFVAASSEGMRVPSDALSGILFGADEMTIALVFRTSTSTGQTLLNKGSNTQGRWRMRVSHTAAGDVQGVLNDGTTNYPVDGSTGSDDGDPHLFVLIRDNAANLMRLRKDSAEVATLDITGCGSTDETAQAAWLSTLLLGCQPAGASTGQHWNGEIGEILFYQDMLEGSDLTNMEAYLSAKWGV